MTKKRNLISKKLADNLLLRVHSIEAAATAIRSATETAHTDDRQYLSNPSDEIRANIKALKEETQNLEILLRLVESEESGNTD